MIIYPKILKLLFFSIVPECVCNSNGTDPGLIDTCNHETGQCKCLPNVIGTQCDKCADGFWDLGSGEGCKKCDCCGEGSTQATCSEVNKLENDLNCKIVSVSSQYLSIRDARIARAQDVRARSLSAVPLTFVPNLFNFQSRFLFSRPQERFSFLSSLTRGRLIKLFILGKNVVVANNFNY